MHDGKQKSSSQTQPYVVSIELKFGCMPIAIGYGQRLRTTTDSTLTHFGFIHIHTFCPTPLFEIYTCFSPNHIVLIVHVYTFILYSVGDYHVSTVHSITTRIPCPNCRPLTLIQQLPYSSVICNCASHQPELGLLTVPTNIHSITV